MVKKKDRVCENCKYEDDSLWEPPCSKCRIDTNDKWKPKEDD